MKYLLILVFINLNSISYSQSNKTISNVVTVHDTNDIRYIKYRDSIAYRKEYERQKRYFLRDVHRCKTITEYAATIESWQNTMFDYTKKSKVAANSNYKDNDTPEPYKSTTRKWDGGNTYINPGSYLLTTVQFGNFQYKLWYYGTPKYPKVTVKYEPIKYRLIRVINRVNNTTDTLENAVYLK